MTKGAGPESGRVVDVRRLAHASAAILAPSLGVPDVLRVVVNTARELLDTHRALVRLTAAANPSDAVSAISLSEAYTSHPATQEPPDLAEVVQRLVRESPVVRLSQQEVAAQVARAASSGGTPPQPPPHNLLAARLTDSEGQRIGWLQVCDKQQGDFSSVDEDVLLHVAQLASAAVGRAQQAEGLQRERTAREAAEETSRLKDEFLAVVSHELRTPLNAILGWASLVREGRVSGDGAVRAVEVIERNARVQKQMVEDLLETSRVITGKLHIEPHPTDLMAVVSEAADALRLAAERKDVRLIVDLDPAVGEVLGDPPRLQQIVWNLLSNAIKFTPANGQVCVILSRVDNRARIMVTDTGRGIAPDFLPYVFEQFRQAGRYATRGHGGLGLGLAIARHLTYAHGGTITAANRSDHPGAVFTVELPIHRSRSAPARAPRDRPAAPARVIGARILIIEEEADAREFLRLVLEHTGAAVSAAASVAEGREALATGAYDMLLVNPALPDEDGLSLVPWLRTAGAEAHRNSAVVALTADPSARRGEELRAAGFDDTLTKPFDPSSVVTLVARVLEERCGTPSE